jgi:hypothetical protein
MHRPFQVDHSSFIEGLHMTKNTASESANPETFFAIKMLEKILKSLNFRVFLIALAFAFSKRLQKIEASCS